MTDITALLKSAAEEVLETMFFTSPVDRRAAPELCAEALAVQLRIAGSWRGGSWRGTFDLELPVETAKRLGATLLGATLLGEEERDISDTQARDAATEIANVICGATLSKWRSGALFSLEPVLPGRAEPPGAAAISGSLPSISIPEGSLSLRMQID